MGAKRPEALDKSGAETLASNDRRISDALKDLEAGRKGRGLRLTIALLMELTDLSRNTIKKRPGIQRRLEEIEAKRSASAAAPSAGIAEGQDSVSTVERLTSDKEALIKQNVLFFDEILNLRAQIKRKDAELRKLRGRT